jgi:hypothetical protein
MATHNWNIDVAHSGINFSIRHMVVSKLRGRFTKFTGTVRLDEGGDLTRSSVEASIDASGIDTGSAQRDDHLRGTDFFDVDRSPQLRFRSTQVLCSAWDGRGGRATRGPPDPRGSRVAPSERACLRESVPASGGGLRGGLAAGLLPARSAAQRWAEGDRGRRMNSESDGLKRERAVPQWNVADRYWQFQNTMRSPAEQVQAETAAPLR